jgi:hypothetical protein
MKILKVYDKINRNVLQYDQNTGSLTVREFHSDTDYFTLIINTKVFKIKSERMAFLSCINTVNGIARESLDITSKYVFFVITDEIRDTLEKAYDDRLEELKQIAVKSGTTKTITDTDPEFVKSYY